MDTPAAEAPDESVTVPTREVVLASWANAKLVMKIVKTIVRKIVLLVTPDKEFDFGSVSEFQHGSPPIVNIETGNKVVITWRSAHEHSFEQIISPPHSLDSNFLDFLDERHCVSRSSEHLDCR